MSRHRGLNRKCRYDRLIFINLLSPKYFLSVDQISISFTLFGSLKLIFISV